MRCRRKGWPKGDEVTRRGEMATREERGSTEHNGKHRPYAAMVSGPRMERRVSELSCVATRSDKPRDRQMVASQSTP